MNEYNNQVADSPISVKIVANGLEHYTVDNRRYKLESNSYLIINKGDEFEVDVKTNNITNGVCIYPPEKIINEIFDYRLESQDRLLEAEGFNQNEIKFTQKKNALANSTTGLFLKEHLPNILNKGEEEASVDFNNLYIQLAEHLVQDQLVLDCQLLNLKASKKQTSEELYRRISIAKEYIHDNYNQKIIIDDLAAIACLSKYHFLRSFSDFYKCTPYQYILKLKLEAARKLIVKGFSYPQISELIGFSDSKNLRKAINKFC